MSDISSFPDDLIDTVEAAEDLKVKQSTLAFWRATGKGPDFYKFGRGIFYSRKINAAWKSRQRRSPRHIETVA
jgi:hypothetical protein